MTSYTDIAKHKFKLYSKLPNTKVFGYEESDESAFFFSEVDGIKYKHTFDSIGSKIDTYVEPEKAEVAKAESTTLNPGQALLSKTIRKIKGK